MQVGDLVEITTHVRLVIVQGLAVVTNILQEVDEFGFVNDPNDWAYEVVGWIDHPRERALHRRVFECEVEKLS